jgi:hypothetical protein
MTRYRHQRQQDTPNVVVLLARTTLLSVVASAGSWQLAAQRRHDVGRQRRRVRVVGETLLAVSKRWSLADSAAVAAPRSKTRESLDVL